MISLLFQHFKMEYKLINIEYSKDKHTFLAENPLSIWKHSARFPFKAYFI